MLAATMAVATAQIMEPVKWKSHVEKTSDTEGVIVFSAEIAAGWHVYSTDVDPSIGPSPLLFHWDKLSGVKLEGKPTATVKPHKQYDDMFEAELSWWVKSVTLKQKFKTTADKYQIAGSLEYSACNDENCIPPTKEPFSFTGTGKAAATTEKEPDVAATDTAAAPTPTETVADTATVAATAATASGNLADNPLWKPIVRTAGDSGIAATGSSSMSLWYVFFLCFVGGLLALLTPCVWPMIPLTVSFFLKKGKSRSKSIADAFAYGVSIIVIYLVLGLLITWIWGADSLNMMSTNAVVNIVFFLLLVVFAISFFGAFEIRLPSSWANKMDTTAEKTTGLLSIFFMAFTLAIVSFSCTGPIIGTLLVEAASSGNKLGPAVGMFGFSLALAIPFFFFALFPSMLQSAPKSGKWMNTIKVVLGFIELALSLKFLSVADLTYGWHILDREVFLALWIIIFGLLGIYLLGKFNFSHYGKADSSIGVFRFFLAMISLSFTVYLIPGLWGAPLKSVSAFVPPLFTQDFNLYGGGVTEYDDYDVGMKAAIEAGKPVLVDFSGYGCVNCRKMEAAVLDNEGVHRTIEENFIVVKLMNDDRKPLPSPITITENGREKTLTTVGEKWSYLQRYKFNANAQPYYVILNGKGELLSGPFDYNEDIPAFTEFLNKGIQAYRK